MPPITQGATLDVEDAIGALAEAFRQAEAELRADLERVVHAVALDPTSTKRYRDAQIRGILGRVATIRADLEGQATMFVAETLPAIYTEGMGRADRLLRAAGVDVGQGSFTALHREALEVLAADTFDDLAAATGYLEASTKRTIREAAKIRTTVGAARGTTVGQDTRALVRTLEQQGVTGFVDRAGRAWRISSYAEMVTRTKSAHAYNTGTVLRAEETGTTVFEIYDGERSGHEECLAHNRRTCTSAWALAHPVQHPNCVRAFGPLPLHRGGVDYGGEDGTTAAGQVRDRVSDDRRRQQEAPPEAGTLRDDPFSRPHLERSVAKGGEITPTGNVIVGADRVPPHVAATVREQADDLTRRFGQPFSVEFTDEIGSHVGDNAFGSPLVRLTTDASKYDALSGRSDVVARTVSDALTHEYGHVLEGRMRYAHLYRDGLAAERSDAMAEEVFGGAMSAVRHEIRETAARQGDREALNALWTDTERPIARLRDDVSFYACQDTHEAAAEVFTQTLQGVDNPFTRQVRETFVRVWSEATGWEADL